MQTRYSWLDGWKKHVLLCWNATGVENAFQIPEKQILIRSNEAEKSRERGHIKAGSRLPIEMRAAYKAFSRAVRRAAKPIVAELIRNSDGRCVYTGERLISREQFAADNPGVSWRQNTRMPVVDHRVGLLAGFIKGWSVEQMNARENLCVCSVTSNAHKSFLGLEKFMESDYVKNKIDQAD